MLITTRLQVSVLTSTQKQSISNPLVLSYVNGFEGFSQEDKITLYLGLVIKSIYSCCRGPEYDGQLMHQEDGKYL